MFFQNYELIIFLNIYEKKVLNNTILTQINPACPLNLHDFFVIIVEPLSLIAIKRIFLDKKNSFLFYLGMNEGYM